MSLSRTERENLVLQYIVQYFIDTGTPVGSRSISKKLPIDLSAATIRNIMADLEEKGLLQHPHTSAGRIPTDRGYRWYVDDVVREPNPDPQQQAALERTLGDLRSKITRISDGIDEILFHSSKALARLSMELGIVLSPRFNRGIFDKLTLSRVADDRILVELNLRSGVVRSLVLEVSALLETEELRTIQRALNERLGGLTVAEIRKTLAERVRDLRYRLEDREDRFLQVLLNESQRLFNFEDHATLTYAGTNNILTKPELQHAGGAIPFIEMLEEKDRLIQLLSNRSDDGITITIGEENDSADLNGLTIVTAPYAIGEIRGMVGIVGSKRMPYARIIPLVGHAARLLNQTLNEHGKDS